MGFVRVYFHKIRSLNPFLSRFIFHTQSWSILNKRGLNFAHININSLLPKIDEVRNILNSNKISVLGITESKLDDTINDSEVQVSGYDIIRKDRNRKGGGVALFIKQGIVANKVSILNNSLEYISVRIYEKNKHNINLCIVYRPPNQNSFIDIITEDFKVFESNKNEIIILGDLNINVLYQNQNVLNRKSLPNGNNLHPLLGQYSQFLSSNGLKQIINEPTRTTTRSSTLIDHILTNSDHILQSGTIPIGISDHELIFCTRKLTRPKPGNERFIEFRSFKNYSKELFKDALSKIDFPNYDRFTDVDEASSDFIYRLNEVINNIAPIKKAKIKNNTPEWFDEEVASKIDCRDRNYRIFKKSKLEIHNQIYLQSKNDVKKIIKDKKEHFIRNALHENSGNPKKLWKTLKGLGLSNKSKSTGIPYLKKDGKIQYDTESNSNIFKDYFSNLAEKLVDELPNAPNLYSTEYVSNFYKKLDIENRFQLTFPPSFPRSFPPSYNERTMTTSTRRRWR